ncbi:MAG: HAD family hydrolase [Waddliaceae bacterium]
MLALDIDGTLTSNLKKIPEEVVSFLRESQEPVCLITGRHLSSVEPILAAIDFPYILALQNGSMVMKMPERKVLFTQYLSEATLPSLLLNCADPILYSETVCYWRPKHHTEKMQQYLTRRIDAMNEVWVEIESFTPSPERMFPALKWIIEESQEKQVLKALQGVGVEVCSIRDPFDRSFCVVQATKANKGSIVKWLKKEFGRPVIAAGDDYNDVSMLEHADISIAMASAPKEVKEIADIVAPSAKEMGIIKGLTDAFKSRI